jgi:hypothetical protein
MGTGNHGAEGRYKSGQRFVQGEQPYVLGLDLGYQSLRFGEILLIRGDILRVQRQDFEEKQRNAALVATS